MARQEIYDVQEVDVTISAAGTSGTQADPCNPLRGSLEYVEAKVAPDATVTAFRLELLRYDRVTAAYLTVWESPDSNMANSGDWVPAGERTNIRVPLSFAADGNYTWRVTTNAAATAEMTCHIRRQIRV